MTHRQVRMLPSAQNMVGLQYVDRVLDASVEKEADSHGSGPEHCDCHTITHLFDEVQDQLDDAHHAKSDRCAMLISVSARSVDVRNNKVVEEFKTG